MKQRKLPGVIGGVVGGVVGGVLSGHLGGLTGSHEGESPGPPRPAGFLGAGDPSTSEGLRLITLMSHHHPEEATLEAVLACSPVTPTSNDMAVTAAALRVLADLAEDGRWSAAGGRPALVLLLAAQFPSGAFASHTRAHALAIWAVIEAAGAGTGLLDRERSWLQESAKSGLEHLERLQLRSGLWVAEPGYQADVPASGWAALALAAAAGAERRVAAPLPELGGAAVDCGEGMGFLLALARTIAGESEAVPPSTGALTTPQRLLSSLETGRLRLMHHLTQEPAGPEFWRRTGLLQ